MSRGSTAGYQPANAATMADLEATLALAFPAGNAAHLCRRPRYRKASGGVVITSLSPIPFLSDPVSRNTVNSAYDYAIAKPALARAMETVGWRDLHHAGQDAR